jgi:glucan phosphorylase
MLLRNADRQSPLSSSQTAAQCDTQRLDTVRDRMLDRYIQTLDAIIAAKTSVKVVAYLSVEFLTGPHLRNSLINLGIWDPTREAISKVGQNLSELIGVAYDTPVPGYRVSTTNLLRLWKAEAAESFDFEALMSATITVQWMRRSSQKLSRRSFIPMMSPKRENDCD